MSKKVKSKEVVVKEFLLKKMTEHWMEDNPGLAQDINDLCHEIVIFNLKWGTRFEAVDFIKLSIPKK